MLSLTMKIICIGKYNMKNYFRIIIFPTIIITMSISDAYSWPWSKKAEPESPDTVFSKIKDEVNSCDKDMRERYKSITNETFKLFVGAKCDVVSYTYLFLINLKTFFDSLDEVNNKYGKITKDNFTNLTPTIQSMINEINNSYVSTIKNILDTYDFYKAGIKQFKENDIKQQCDPKQFKKLCNNIEILIIKALNNYTKRFDILTNKLSISFKNIQK